MILRSVIIPKRIDYHMYAAKKYTRFVNFDTCLHNSRNLDGSLCINYLKVDGDIDKILLI